MTSPHGGVGDIASTLAVDGLAVSQQAASVFRPEYGSTQQYALVLNDRTASTRSAPAYSDVKPAVSVQAHLATPTLYFTDQLESSATAARYRTLRVAFMLLDDDYRPHVAPAATALRLEGVGTTSIEASCGTTLSANAHHTCSLQLEQAHFSTTTTSASLELIAGDTSFPMSLVLQPLPTWLDSDCLGLVRASCDSSGSFLYARAPPGLVVAQSIFSVTVHLRHTANAGAVNFRFQLDPSLVEFVGTSMTGSPYAATQLSDPPLSFSGTSFSTGYDALVSASSLETTYSGTAEPTLVCTLQFRALSTGDALRMSVTQVLSVGDSNLLGHS